MSSSGGGIVVVVGRISAAVIAVAAVAAGVLAVPTITGGGGGGGCDRNATTSTFSTQLSAATAGQTLCLASGSYGTFTGTGGNKSAPGVLIEEQDGATATIGIQFRTTTAANLTFDGIDLTGGDINGLSHDVTFKNATVTGQFAVTAGAGPAANNNCSSCSAMDENNIVFDNTTWTLSQCPTGSCLGAEGRLSFIYGSAASSNIVTVRNSTFTGNCADGVQFTGNSNSGRGVTIENNVFEDLQQGSCAPHVDSIQFVDGCCVTVTGNLFRDNSSGFVGYDGAASNTTFTNNVLQGITEGPGYCIGGGDSGLVEHNVFGPDVPTYLCVNHDANTSTGVTWRNNIQDGPPTIQGASSYTVNNYNLCTSGSCAGANSLNGNPTFVGGGSPSSWAGFALAGGSTGKGAASDGTDIGINP